MHVVLVFLIDSNIQKVSRYVVSRIEVICHYHTCNCLVLKRLISRQEKPEPNNACERKVSSVLVTCLGQKTTVKAIFWAQFLAFYEALTERWIYVLIRPDYLLLPLKVEFADQKSVVFKASNRKLSNLESTTTKFTDDLASFFGENRWNEPPEFSTRGLTEIITLA